MIRTISFLALALAAGVQPVLSQTQSAKAFDPVGVYDLDLELHGQVTGAAITIAREKDGRLTATLDVHGQSISFDQVKVENQTVTMEAGTGLSLTLNFQDRDTLSGRWNRPDDSGVISGVRRKG